jgi:hypothetical protein
MHEHILGHRDQFCILYVSELDQRGYAKRRSTHSTTIG